MTPLEKLKRVLSSPLLWGENFCEVIDKQGRRVQFILNPQQRELVENLDKYNIVLKSRQLGITTVSCMLSLYYAITRPSSHCMLISYSLDSANTIFDKLKQIYDDLPQAIRPKDIANNRKVLKFENGSKITVTTMGSKEIARGSSLAFVHISEVAFCKQELVSKQILSIEQALLPDGKIILESTANGLNEFSNMWERAEQGESLYRPFFFSWIEDKKMFADEYKAFTKRYISLHGSSLTFEELEPIERTYHELGASLEQLMWRRLKIANSSEQEFKQEYPVTPIEAFITSGNNIFNSAKIQEEYNQRKMIERLTDIPNIPVILKPYIRSYLTVWEAPRNGDRYYMGVDASEGIGQDYSVIDIYNEDAIEVAQFRSNKIQPYEIANICNELGLWYNRALLIVEKASGGHIILDRLRNTYHYKNMYKHKDYDQKGKMVKKIGYKTTAKTKPILINDFVELWESNDIFIRSLTTLNEMKTYMFSNGSMNGEVGTHDDTVIATALAVQGIKSGINYKW
ncbi:terminase large subunit domain-containing protein [Lacrimispora sp.]|uniref:terminase large subunit domain-containing protein n=1 Tax=Lacrimispora sp. TaxID=2719234 RepID=UPI0028AB5C4F|nr:terminase family protein [Lacrimispora sp.]